MSEQNETKIPQILEGNSEVEDVCFQMEEGLFNKTIASSCGINSGIKDAVLWFCMVKKKSQFSIAP